MDGSHQPILSIGAIKTKVFGRPPDGSVTSQSAQSSNQNISSNRESTPKSPAKAPSLVVTSSRSSKSRSSNTPRSSRSGKAGKSVDSTPQKSPKVTPPPPSRKDFDDDSASYDDEQSNTQKKSITMKPKSAQSNKSPVKLTANKRPASSNKKTPEAKNIQQSSVSSNKKTPEAKNAQQSPAPSSKKASLAKNTQQSPASPVVTTPRRKRAKKIEQHKFQLNQPQSPDDVSYDESPSRSPKRSPNKYSAKKQPKSPSNLAKAILPLVHSLVDEKTEKTENKVDDQKVSSATDELPEWQQNIIMLATPLENDHKQFWFMSVVELLKQHNLYVESDSIAYYKSISARAKEIIRNHRFSYPAGSNYRFKLAVTGPDHSGKSTYISILTQQLLVELYSTDNWKNTLIFPINVATIAGICHDLSQLFQAFAQLTIQAISSQRPLLIPYAEGLTKAFENIINGNPLLPKAFVLDEDFRFIYPQVQQVIDICVQCYRDSTAMAAFTVNIFMLPYLLAKIFGFEHVVVIADHFDLSDITKVADIPFEDSADNIFLAEMFKCLLNHSSFIIGSKENRSFMEVLSSIETENINFTEGIEYLTTLGVVNSDDLESDYDYSYNLAFTNDENPPVTLNSSFLGGCAYYLKLWKEIAAVATNYEEAQKRDELEAEEERLNLINHIQKLLKAILLTESGEQCNLTIKSVTINHKEEAK